jgi:hypothetical protein
MSEQKLSDMKFSCYYALVLANVTTLSVKIIPGSKYFVSPKHGNSFPCSITNIKILLNMTYVSQHSMYELIENLGTKFITK